MEVVEERKLQSVLVGVPSTEVDALWGEIEDFLRKPLERTGVWRDYSTRDLYKKIKDRTMQCWVVVRNERIIGVAITQILQYPQRKLLGIPFVGMAPHTIQYWLGHLEILKDFAKFHECSAIRGWGRAGWVKLLNPDHVRVEFDIEV